MSIGEQLKLLRAERDRIRREVAIAASEQQDASKLAQTVLDQARKEISDFRAELAEITNGAPDEQPATTEVPPNAGPY